MDSCTVYSARRAPAVSAGYLGIEDAAATSNDSGMPASRFLSSTPGPQLAQSLPMFAFLKKPLLRVIIDGTDVAKVTPNDLPCERQPSVRVSPSSSVSFVDSNGRTYRHDLPFEDGWLHLSVRVFEHRVCQADGILSQSATPNPEAFGTGADRGIRFNPFYLPGCQADEQELKGRGLFFRGLHFSGRITPGNVSLSCICDACARSFRLQSFHTGFGNCAYFYSESGRDTLIVEDTVPGCPAVLASPAEPALAEFEQRLPRAKTDGTTFRYSNPLRCPHCSGAYIDFRRFPNERPTEYYGNHFFGEQPQFLRDVQPDTPTTATWDLT